MSACLFRYDVESTFPGVVMELTDQEIKDYFTPRDFMIGKTVTIYNRRFYVYEMDNFTKAFYWKNFGITDFSSVDVEQPPKQLARMVSRHDRIDHAAKQSWPVQLIGSIAIATLRILVSCWSTECDPVIEQLRVIQNCFFFHSSLCKFCKCASRSGKGNRC